MKIKYRLWTLIVLWSIFFWVSQAGYMWNIFGNMQMFALNDTIWTDKIFDMPDKSYSLHYHDSANEEPVDNIITLDSSYLEQLLLANRDFSWFYKQIRQHIIQTMIQEWFSGFVVQPWKTANDIINFDSWSLNVHLHNSIQKQDSLDLLLTKKLDYYKTHFDAYKKFSAFASFPRINIKKKLLLNLQDVFLFKDNEDLKSLGYEVVSYRSRINNDKKYRRYNIHTAFANMGNVLVINPQQSYSIMPNLHYNANNPSGKKAFMQWYAIIGDEEKLVYAWWLCGVATAVSQGILTNLWFKFIEKQAHSKRYKSLYTAFINWKLVDIPGLDATVYSNRIDLRFQNIRDYPMIIVMNYDGSKWWLEQVFSLAPHENIWDFSYLWYHRRWTNKCYSRKINWETTTHCYNEVKR